MLFRVVLRAQADRPCVRRLKAHSAIGPSTDVGAFDGTAETSYDAAMMASYPSAVGRAVPLQREAADLFEASWQMHFQASTSGCPFDVVGDDAAPGFLAFVSERFA